MHDVLMRWSVLYSIFFYTIVDPTLVLPDALGVSVGKRRYELLSYMYGNDVSVQLNVAFLKPKS